MRDRAPRKAQEDIVDKDKALEMAVVQIERQFGKGAIMRMGDESAAVRVPAIPTGALSLDLALGVGGVPRGRVVEIFGPESSGKTTLALHILAEAQKRGGKAAFIDAEHAMDAMYARRIGVNVDDLLVSQPDHGEQALEICELLIRSGALDVVVVDSVAALTPRAEIEGDMGDSHMGLQARLMSQALRKLAGTINKTQTSAIFINQLREKVGIMFGNPEVTPGGRALKFYASVRLDIRRLETLKDGDQAVGSHVRVRVVKNKVAPPFRQAEFDIMFGTGISYEGDVLDLAVEHGIVQKSGAWFSYGDQRLGQGRENVKQFLRDNPDLTEALREGVVAAVHPDWWIGPGGEGPAVAADEEAMPPALES
ncbi:MAG: recombinase RecA [Gaiellales bacterium]|nr:recombinase RecA [Gaiellales bacterium]